MEITENFERTIAPFFWVDHDESASVCLNVGEYLQDVFDGRADDGFEGNGYDWASLAQVFLNEKCPQLLGKVDRHRGFAFARDAAGDQHCLGPALG